MRLRIMEKIKDQCEYFFFVLILNKFRYNFNKKRNVLHLHPRNTVVAEQGENSLCSTHDVIVRYFPNKARNFTVYFYLLTINSISQNFIHDTKRFPK